jgi:hypothetical protein
MSFIWLDISLTLTLPDARAMIIAAVSRERGDALHCRWHLTGDRCILNAMVRLQVAMAWSYRHTRCMLVIDEVWYITTEAHNVSDAHV